MIQSKCTVQPFACNQEVLVAHLYVSLPWSPHICSKIHGNCWARTSSLGQGCMAVCWVWSCKDFYRTLYISDIYGHCFDLHSLCYLELSCFPYIVDAGHSVLISSTSIFSLPGKLTLPLGADFDNQFLCESFHNVLRHLENSSFPNVFLHCWILAKIHWNSACDLCP